MAGAYSWVDVSPGAIFPASGLLGGRDLDGSQIYVGQGFHNGDWLPAKVIPSKRAVYVAHGGKEILVPTFKVLSVRNPRKCVWVYSTNGNIPAHAIVGGRTSTGEILYIGRVNHEGTITVGKVHPSHGTCYIPFNGKEHAFKNYEVLTYRP